MAFKYKIVNEEFEGEDAAAQAESCLEDLSLKGWTLESARVTDLMPDGIRIEAIMSKEKP